MSQKFHINKHGVPAPCKATKGNCPLGGDESHFDNLEEAQNYADRQNEKAHGLLPSNVPQEETVIINNRFHGNNYGMDEQVKLNMAKKLTDKNVGEILDAGLAGADRFDVTYEVDAFDNTPVSLDVAVRKTGENTYNIKGTLLQYSMAEDDFDSEEEYEEYLEGGPDMDYDVDYDFSSEELGSRLAQLGVLKSSGVDAADTPGSIVAGIYELSADSI